MIGMSHGVRLLRPERDQLRWDLVDLNSQLPPEHRARLVWSFVSTLELSAFYARIKARDGVGAARAIARLCASIMRPIAGCAGVFRSTMTCCRNSAARAVRCWTLC